MAQSLPNGANMMLGDQRGHGVEKGTRGMTGVCGFALDCPPSLLAAEGDRRDDTFYGE